MREIDQKKGLGQVSGGKRDESIAEMRYRSIGCCIRKFFNCLSGKRKQIRKGGDLETPGFVWVGRSDDEGVGLRAW